MDKVARILVIDDDPDLGVMIKRMLEYKGYAVTLSERAEQPEEIIGDNNIDLVILDMLLSGANGMDICLRLKKNNSTSHLPIMMISAHPNAKEASVKAGADDFISKPFDMQELLSKISSLLNKEQKV